MNTSETLPMPELSPDDVLRFWGHVDMAGPDDCWLFDAHTGYSRYGRFSYRHRPYGAHRIAFFLATGGDPGDLLVLHSCDTPRCVNPRHLALGTARDNTLDCKAKGRLNTAAGEKHGTHTRPDRVARGEKKSPLTDSDVVAIRTAYADGGITQQALADRYGVDRGTIKDIISGKNWAHLPVVDREKIRAISDRNRGKRGSESQNALLTEDSVRDIRRRYAAGTTTHAKLAAEFGVSVATIAHVCQRRSWTHLE